MKSQCIALSLMWLFSLANNPTNADDHVPVANLENSAFKDAWHAVVEQAGITADFVTMSRADRREAMVRGNLAMDCCSIPAWRSRPQEQAVQLYSDPLFYATEHLVFHKDKKAAFSGSIDLSSLRVAMVEGFNHRDQNLFGEIVYAPTMTETYALVASGKADVTFANSQEFWRRQRLTDRPIVLGPVYQQMLLRVRVHKDWHSLLPRINGAIKKLRESGEFNLLMGQRIRDLSKPK